MKEIMLIGIGVGAGFAICGCLMFYIMATVTRSNTKGQKHMETTEILMRERNDIDRMSHAELRSIAHSLKVKETPAKN